MLDLVWSTHPRDVGGMGFKVMHWTGPRVYTAAFIPGSPLMRVGVRYTFSGDPVFASARRPPCCYPNGFHILQSRRDAERVLLKEQGAIPNLRWVRVRYQGVVATGSEWGVPVLVVRELTIAEEGRSCRGNHP